MELEALPQLNTLDICPEEILKDWEHDIARVNAAIENRKQKN
jgi:hypothetical protein